MRTFIIIVTLLLGATSGFSKTLFTYRYSTPPEGLIGMLEKIHEMTAERIDLRRLSKLLGDKRKKNVRSLEKINEIVEFLENLVVEYELSRGNKKNLDSIVNDFSLSGIASRTRELKEYLGKVSKSEEDLFVADVLSFIEKLVEEERSPALLILKGEIVFSNEISLDKISALILKIRSDLISQRHTLKAEHDALFSHDTKIFTECKKIIPLKEEEIRRAIHDCSKSRKYNRGSSESNDMSCIVENFIGGARGWGVFSVGERPPASNLELRLLRTAREYRCGKILHKRIFPLESELNPI